MNMSETLPVEFTIPEDKHQRLVISSVLLYIGVCLNIAVLVSLLKTWRPDSRIQFFILCLCTADLLGLCFHLGIDIGWIATYVWTAGNVGCKICMFLLKFGHTMAHYFLASFNVDNVITICCYKSRKVTRILLIVVSIFAAVCVCVPEAFVFSTHIHPHYQELIQCAKFDFFEDQESETIYLVVYTVGIYWFPLLFVIFTGILAIIAWLTKRATEEFEEAKKKTPDGSDLQTFGLDLAMVSAFNVVFFVCWTPTCVLFLIERLGTLNLAYDRLEVLWLAFKYIAVINSCLNPVIYGIFTCIRRKREPLSGLEPSPTFEENKAFVE
ncbi:adipokinetic hormone/corazonin-related peptide receptor variant I-like [Haliotis rufescens]|uniref:adipokinetic hormone/corazonin-related peptide receptor variant I-like n=1 Tax=Haliotis rufescens TaxID=6454 RepID=UPI00201EFAC0|nr:adipokinetic hormone/corazonin-related peptide receptor variant I-like [Haliotis rufescens]